MKQLTIYDFMSTKQIKIELEKEKARKENENMTEYLTKLLKEREKAKRNTFKRKD